MVVGEVCEQDGRLLGQHRVRLDVAERRERRVQGGLGQHEPRESDYGLALDGEQEGGNGVLLAHLANNHPLPDANKRAAFLLTARFLDANGLTWRAPDVEIDAGIVERIAAGEAAHDEIVDWIRERTRKEGDEPRAIS